MTAKKRILFCISFLLLAGSPSLALSETNETIRVPFVGCESEGQAGPVAAPKGTEMALQLDARVAGKLAYYKAESTIGVLAPLGWSCFGIYGSNGAALLVTPDLPKREDLFSPTGKSIATPAIQISTSYGKTSGRFDVARVIARIFPLQKAFVQDVIRERIEPAENFPSGPYPDDTITYRRNRIVEFKTPPNEKGLGTMSRLQPSSLSIDGVAILTDEMDLLFLTVRLPSDKTDLKSSIIQQVEQEHESKARR
jgi:hypothetical protein